MMLTKSGKRRMRDRPPWNEEKGFRTAQAVRRRCMTGKAMECTSSFTNELTLAWSVPQRLDSSVGNTLCLQYRGAELKSNKTTEFFLYGSLWA